MQYLHRNWKLIIWAVAIVVFGCSGPAERSAWAQNSVAGWPQRADRGEYTIPKPQELSFKIRTSVARNLRNGKFESAEEEQDFADYYKLSLFPNVILPANHQPPKDDQQPPKDDMITKLRKDVKTCEKAADQQVFNKLADLILDYMTDIAKDGRYHPVARVNAMLAIGEINSPKAAKVLLDTAFGKDKEQVFALRVAAMTGLVRMAGPSGKMAGAGNQKVLSDPEIEPLVVTNMIAVAQAKRKDDGLYWMRGQAADVFADLGSIGSNGEVPPALLVMLGDKGLPIPLRSKAARALGKLNYGDNPPAAAPCVKALAEFARDALGSDQPADRGRVRLVIRDVLDGLKKFAALTPPQDRALSDGLKKTLDALNKETEVPLSRKEKEIDPFLDKARESLKGLLGSNP